MKKLILAAVAALSLGGAAAPAHATLLQCSGFSQIAGYAGHNPPVTATVAFGNGGWFVHYILQNGMIVDRSMQFGMSDATDNTKTEWWGWLNKNPNKWMRGRIMKRNADGHLLYFEELFDRSNTLLASNTIDCGPDPDAAPPPSYRPPTTPGQTIVALNSTDGQNLVYVTVGSTLTVMAIDSGCSSFAITPALADQLIASGEATYLGSIQMQLAGDRIVTGRSLNIHRVVLGGVVLTEIRANDGGDGMQLLGMSVLGRFGKFTIDIPNNRLILG